MKDGHIAPDSEEGSELGFTEDKFSGWLWKNGDRIIVSMIESKQQGKGNFKWLIDNIKAQGYKVDIPTPIGRMSDILRDNGYKMRIVNDPIWGSAEVWSEDNPQ